MIHILIHMLKIKERAQIMLPCASGDEQFTAVWISSSLKPTLVALAFIVFMLLQV